MFHNLRTKAKKKWFNHRCGGVLSSAPLKTKPSPVAIVTMMCHADLIMYLVSIKSFYPRLGHGHIFILDDGSLDEKDKEILNHHLSNPEIIPISKISTGACPKGGCWERIMLVSQLAEEYFVIQLDADIVTVGPVEEVQAAAEAQKSFTLGTPQGLKFITLAEASKAVVGSTGKHVQTLSERHFQNLNGSGVRKYVRGCAGFAGFAKGSIRKANLESFSLEMENGIGSTWKNWGSEQVTSNYVVSNSESSLVLPFPKYGSFEPGVDLSQSSVLHFYGPYRFADGEYIRRSRESMKYSSNGA